MELKKSKKIFKFFEKNFIIKKCAYGLKMKPHQVLHEYFEVYGQAGKITPEAGEKRAPFSIFLPPFLKVENIQIFNSIKMLRVL